MIQLDPLFAGPPPKRDRDAAFFSYTRSICPTCKKVIDAHIVLRDDKVWMQKKCPRHGFFEVEVSSDAEYYIRSLSYTKPGTVPYRFATKSNTAARKIAACVKITCNTPVRRFSRSTTSAI